MASMLDRELDASCPFAPTHILYLTPQDRFARNLVIADITEAVTATVDTSDLDSTEVHAAAHAAALASNEPLFILQASRPRSNAHALLLDHAGTTIATLENPFMSYGAAKLTFTGIDQMQQATSDGCESLINEPAITSLVHDSASTIGSDAIDNDSANDSANDSTNQPIQQDAPARPGTPTEAAEIDKQAGGANQATYAEPISGRGEPASTNILKRIDTPLSDIVVEDSGAASNCVPSDDPSAEDISEAPLTAESTPATTATLATAPGSIELKPLAIARRALGFDFDGEAWAWEAAEGRWRSGAQRLVRATGTTGKIEAAQFRSRDGRFRPAGLLAVDTRNIGLAEAVGTLVGTLRQRDGFSMMGLNLMRRMGGNEEQATLET